MPSTPHDELFKEAFSRPENAAGELRRVLPRETLARLDLAGLRRVPGTFVDVGLGARQVDLLFAVPTRGGPDDEALVYLLYEHQSTSDRWMALRILRYQVRIWTRVLKEDRQRATLPPIVPVVVQHDPRGWRATLSLHGLFPSSLMSDPLLSSVTPSSRYLVDDLVRATDGELLRSPLPAFGRLVLWALRDARRERLVHTLPAFGALLGELASERADAMDLARILRYILNVEGSARLDRVIDLLPEPEVREAAMTIAEQLRREGEQRGLERGREEGQRALLLRQLRHRFGVLPDSVHARVEGASADQLDALGERLLDAESLAALFADPE